MCPVYHARATRQIRHCCMQSCDGATNTEKLHALTAGAPSLGACFGAGSGNSSSSSFQRKHLFQRKSLGQTRCSPCCCCVQQTLPLKPCSSCTCQEHLLWGSALVQALALAPLPRPRKGLHQTRCSPRCCCAQPSSWQAWMLWGPQRSWLPWVACHALHSMYHVSNAAFKLSWVRLAVVNAAAVRSPLLARLGGFGGLSGAGCLGWPAALCATRQSMVFMLLQRQGLR